MLKSRCLTAAVAATAVLAGSVVPAEARTVDYQWFVPATISGTTASEAFDELPVNKVCLFNRPSSGTETNIDPDGLVQKHNGPHWNDLVVKNSPYPKYAQAAGVEFKYDTPWDSPDFDWSKWSDGDAGKLLAALQISPWDSLAYHLVVTPKFYDPANPKKFYKAGYDKWWNDSGTYLEDEFSGSGIVEYSESAIKYADLAIGEAEKKLAENPENNKNYQLEQIALGKYTKLVHQDYLQSLDDCVASLGYGKGTITGTKQVGPNVITGGKVKENSGGKDNNNTPAAETGANTGKIIGIVVGVIAAIAALLGAAAFFAPQLGIKLPF